VKNYVELREDVEPELMHMDTDLEGNTLKSYILVKRVKPQFQETGEVVTAEQQERWRDFDAQLERDLRERGNARRARLYGDEEP